MSEAMTYTGNGDLIFGVPLRDLTAEEWAAIDKKVQAALLKAGQFTPAKKSAKKEEADK